jgi:hypothetical protein
MLNKCQLIKFFDYQLRLKNVNLINILVHDEINYLLFCV